jgi:septal ring factor EnvC (AmiA/AmiB activator)
MTAHLAYCLLALLVCGAGASPLPDQQELKKRQEELQTLRDQIREHEERITEQQLSETATLDLLDSYDKKGTLLRKLVRRLHRDEDELQRKIDVTQKTLVELRSQLDYLKRQYAQYVSSVYKAGALHDFELLLAARSINQFYIRNEYLRRFSAQRKSDVDRITGKAREIEEVNARAQQQLTEQRRLIAEKGAEEDRLASLADERRELLGRIRSDRRQLQREMERKMKAAKELEDVMARLIETERLRKERQAEENRREPSIQPPVAPGAGFEAKRGHLPWPVSEGAVVAHFGTQRHPTLRTVTQNIGIDIAVKTGTPVLSVAGAEVSRILWLPSYGNIVLLSHDNGYRTIYTHLSEIYVAEGQTVAEGEAIGESGESVDGPRLHFEVWKEKEKQDPEAWLRRK